MAQRLTRIDPLQAAKMAGVLYFLLGLLVTPFFYYAFVISPEGLGFPPGFVFGLPFLYAGIGFAFTALACGCYNILARRLGGIEVELSSTTSA